MTFKQQFYQIVIKMMHVFEIIPVPDNYEPTQKEDSSCQVYHRVIQAVPREGQGETAVAGNKLLKGCKNTVFLRI